MNVMSFITSRIAAGSSTILALAMLAAVPTVSTAAEPMKGAGYLLRGINTKGQAEALQVGDTMAMVCAKCKSVMIHNVTVQKGHVQMMTVGEKHLCPGCDSTIKVVGVGHGAKDEVKHVCDKCGSDSVFCCATKPGSGPTAGMEKK